MLVRWVTLKNFMGYKSHNDYSNYFTIDLKVLNHIIRETGFSSIDEMYVFFKRNKNSIATMLNQNSPHSRDFLTTFEITKKSQLPNGIKQLKIIVDNYNELSKNHFSNDLTILKELEDKWKIISKISKNDLMT